MVKLLPEVIYGTNGLPVKVTLPVDAGLWLVFRKDGRTVKRVGTISYAGGVFTSDKGFVPKPTFMKLYKQACAILLDSKRKPVQRSSAEQLTLKGGGLV